ncbi:MAG: tetratricopeptide repeat protein [Planctomycetes bacterium]|nr:tetratricopeptide repeat protein [Planctomycetota bacterium]
MSNTNEPNATPEQPDPKSAEAQARAEAARRAGGSSFEFILPDGINSYSDLPPVDQPDPTDTDALHKAALPPRPVAARPASNTFDFIELPDADPGSGVQKKSNLPPAAPAAAGGLVSTDDVIVLPFLPGAPGDSSVALAEQGPPAEAPSFVFGGETDLARVPDALAGAPSSKASVPDIASLFPASSDSNVFSAPAPVVPEVPPVPAPDSVPDLADVSLVPDVPATDPGSFVLGAEALPEIDLGLPGVSSDSAILAELLPEVPAGELVDSAAVLDAVPDVPPAVPASSGDSSAALGATLEPVAPASGWLDSDVLDGPPVLAAPVAPVPTANPLDAPAAQPVDSSDIFSGGRPLAAQPVELADVSDVISATAYGPGGPPAAVPPSGRASEIALTFDNPPGGSTVSEPDSGELPLADEVPGSSALLGAPGADGESIHDMPDPLGANPLFDSARLANAPELPDVPVADAPEYGAVPDYSADASSILADLSDERPLHSGDSSSVRVEAPGVGRSVTGGPGDGTFDLTVDDEPIPAGLFDEPAPDAPSGPEPTDWQSQSGSDLFADKRTAPEIDLGAEDSGTVEPVDADLSSEQPSLSSAPSSIFSGPPPVADSRAGSGGASSGSDALGGTAERAKDAPPAVPPRKARASSGDFELPAPAAADADDGGAIDWDSAELAGGDEATRGIPKDASLSAILKNLGDDDSTESPTKDSDPVADAVEEDGEPLVTVDWMAGSGEGSAIREPEATDVELDDKIQSRRKGKDAEKAKPRAAVGGTAEMEAEAAPAAKVDPKGKARAPRAPADSGTAERATDTKAKPAKKGGGLVTGVLLGTLFAGGAWAGLYFGDVIPNAKPTAQNPPPQPPQPPGMPPGMQPPGQQPPPPQQPADPQAAFLAGDTKAALDLLKTTAPTTTAGKAAAGHARVFAKLQGVGTDDDLKQGRADLEAVLADADAAKTPEGLARVVQATVTLGASYEASGDVAKARALFTEAKGKYPKFADVFDGLLIKLDAPAAPGAFRFTPTDAERAALAALVLLAADPAADLAEPGTFYWKAVKAGADGKYAEAVDLIGQAKAAHVARAKVLAGRGLNPLTDPLEQMFPRACDELATYWKVRAELYRNPALADAIKKDGLPKALDAFAKAQADLVTAKADAKAATDKVTKLEGDVAKLDKEVKAEKVAKTEAEDKLKTATAALDAADKLVKDKDALLAQVVTELKPAVPLPDKWAPAELVAGVKSAAARATGPDLKNLVSNAMVAIGGGGLSAGQLLDIADRLKKAEAAAKVATDKLASETKLLTDKYDTDTGKLKTDHAAAVKKLTDGYAADTKKLKDDHAAAVTKLKDDAADAAKKAGDKFAADVKKLTEDHTAAVKKLGDDNTAAVKKLNDDHATALKAEQAKTDAEKKAAALKEIGFQKQLANAVTPAQSLDIVLPVLTDLRRPADADAALGIAKRALAASLPDSDDAAKAHTVIGMALLLKGDLAGAKDEFETARRGPAYKAAAGKAKWAAVADTGLEAVDDPLAPYRKAVVLPPTNLKVATKSLDMGIAAYKSGKYDAAVAALTSAAKNDPADPVAWYYLGATRWAQGDEAQAKKDFEQGAEREKASGTSARTLGAALAPLQGTVRDALDRARP